ncbi:lactate/malate dehydrogenase, NAD binding domain protein [Teladorsagia circumcincta]|uniref:Malate dehydrogenase, cytoplasmic n=1 Tax=Teladorsagia circumcincta TaxID=45464 RepID=A0A2G9V3T0_TELCI|nr:lactate/malate dehydrogenase, NAD binding domain protein [Teladorsagia circumcincta]
MFMLHLNACGLINGYRIVWKTLKFVCESKVNSTLCIPNVMAPLRVLVTGAAGQIGYAIVLQIAKGDVFGRNTPVFLVLLDLPSMATVLEGVQYELQDCALANLLGVECVTTEREAFTDIDYAFLVGGLEQVVAKSQKSKTAQCY